MQFHVAPQPLHFMPQRRCVRFSKLLRRLLLPLPFPPPPQLPFQAGTRGQGAALRGSPGTTRKEPWLQGRSSSSRGSRPRCPVSFWPPACSSRVFLLLLRVPPKNPAPCSHPTPLPTASPLTGQEQKAQELPAACPPASWGTQGPASAVLHPLCQQGCPRPRSQTMGTMRPLPALVYPFPPRPGPVPLPRHRETLPQEGGK